MKKELLNNLLGCVIQLYTKNQVITGVLAWLGQDHWIVISESANLDFTEFEVSNISRETVFTEDGFVVIEKIILI